MAIPNKFLNNFWLSMVSIYQFQHFALAKSNSTISLLIKKKILLLNVHYVY